MRLVLFTFSIIVATTVLNTPTKAQNYPWCAINSDGLSTIGKKCTDRSTLPGAGPDFGDGRCGHSPRHDRRSRCGSGTSEWGPSYNATDERLRLIAVVLKPPRLILVIDIRLRSSRSTKAAPMVFD